MYKQTTCEWRGVGNSMAGINAYLQSGHEGKNQTDCDCYLRVCI